jgi:hypothetical protein
MASSAPRHSHTVCVGDRVVIEERHVEAVVEELCAGCACCSWTDTRGVRRRSWISEERLCSHAAGEPRREHAASDAAERA